jgi:hypothetical protein
VAGIRDSDRIGADDASLALIMAQWHNNDKVGERAW